MTANDKAAKSGLNTHIDRYKRNPAPDPAPIRAAMELLRIRSIDRASSETVRQWRNGTRAAPSWFISLLGDMAAELENRASEVRRGLAAYPGGPGLGGPLRRYWAERKRRENAALSESVRKTRGL